MSLLFDLFRCEPHFLKLKAGDCLFKAGDPSEEKMYVLVAGKARIMINDRIAEEAEAGTIVGEMGLVSPHEARTASVLALTDCEFAEIGPKRFNFLVAETPYFAIEVMRVLADRLRRTDRMLA